MTEPLPVYGLMAEFLLPEEILEATKRAREAGYRDMDAYTPYPIEGLAAALGMKSSWIPSIVFIGGLVGASVGFFMQYFSMAVDYPLNSGGRPLNSWPVFIPITFEVFVLIAAFAAFLGVLYLNGLPRPHHPVFEVPAFARASQDRFFLCIEAVDPRFDLERTAAFLTSLPLHGSVIVVPREQLEEPEIAEAEAEPRLAAPTLETALPTGAD